MATITKKENTSDVSIDDFIISFYIKIKIILLFKTIKYFYYRC